MESTAIQTAVQGNPVSISAPERPGYSLNQSKSILSGTADDKLVLKLYYDLPEIAVPVQTWIQKSDGSYGLESTRSQQAKAGTKVSVTAPARTGYTLNGSKSVLSGTASNKLVLKLYYDLPQVKITIQTWVQKGDGTFKQESSRTQSHLPGSAVSVSAPARTGYTLDKSRSVTSGKASSSLVLKLYYAVSTQSMFRLYNPNSGEHFYTANANEKKHLVSLGWKDEGIGWKAPVTGTPVYRLYNPNAGDHHYTMDANEKKHLVSVGWKDEGIGWHAADKSGIPLYRQYNPNAKSGSHNYTTSKGEHDYLVKIGWHGEGIGWYGQK